jgi:hypothetical protein
MCPNDDEVLRVLLGQRHQADAIGVTQAEQGRVADSAISSAEAFLREKGIALPQRRATTAVSDPGQASPKLRSWEEISAEARLVTSERVSIADLLTADEIRSVVNHHRALEVEFAALHELDTFDWCISGAAGVLGALIDIFLVQVPKHPGFLGGQGSEGGWLSNAVKTAFGRVLPAEKIRSLEDAYRVSYDASTSAGCSIAL